ncbi:hypothetical protein K9N50_02325 [bacterium]|nr:hypothetical protein [bacterium]
MIKFLKIFTIIALFSLSVVSSYALGQLKHFPNPHRSSVNMSILMQEISGIDVADSSEIAVLTPDGIVAGATVLIIDDRHPPWGMAAWTDDKTTDELDGFETGDTIRFLFWDPISQREIPAIITNLVNGVEPYFIGDGLLVVKLNVEPPELEWTEIPEEVIVNAGELITFTVRGESHLYLDELTLSYSSDNLPPQATFTDSGDGSGVFNWQTAVTDSGSYQALFILFNGTLEIHATVQIRVVAPSSPEWIVPPQDTEGEERGRIHFRIEGTDINDDNLTIEYWSPNIPFPATFTDSGDGIGVFNWQTTIFDAGIYTAEFTLSDGIYNLITTIEITITEGIITGDPYELSSPVPNPFNSSASVHYKMPVDKEHRLIAFDSSGRKIRLISEGYKQGEYNVQFNSDDFSSGLYIFMLEVGLKKQYSSGIALK